MKKTITAQTLESITLSKREEIMNSFDFEKVHALMVVNKWTWATCNAVPTIIMMRHAVEEMFDALLNSYPNTRVGRGGFKLMRFVWENSVEIELVFAFESTSATEVINLPIID